MSNVKDTNILDIIKRKEKSPSLFRQQERRFSTSVEPQLAELIKQLLSWGAQLEL